MNYSMEQNDDSDGDTSIPSIINRTTLIRSDLPKKQKSKFKGVFRVGKKFKAQIQVNGVQNYLGLYESEDEAAKAYDMHARALLSAKAKTNFHYDDSCDLPNADTLCIPPTQGVQLRVDGDVTNTSVSPRLSHDVGTAQLRRSYVGIKARRRRKTEIVLIGVGEAAGTANSALINGSWGRNGVPTGRSNLKQQYSLHPPISQDMQLHQQQLRQHQLMLLDQHNGSLNTSSSNSIHPMFSGNGGNATNDQLFGHSQTEDYQVHPLHSHRHAGAIPFMPQQHHPQQTAVQSLFKPDHSSFEAPAPSEGAAGPIIPLNNKVNSIDKVLGEPFQAQGTMPKLSSSMLYPDDTKLSNYESSESIISAPFDYKQTWWRGELTYGASYGKLWWKGKIVSSFSGKPTAEEFSWSTNEFVYTSVDAFPESTIIVNGIFRPPKSMHLQGHYLTDNATTGSKEKNQDLQHYVEFSENINLYGSQNGMSTDRSMSQYTVAGQGSSDFGPFMLNGVFSAATQVLEISRQYGIENSMFSTFVVAENGS